MENELIVRLVECAKPLNSVYDSNDPTQVLVTGWTDTTTIPKRGEICLEYYTNTDTSSANYGKICYRMKIGDGIHKYIEPNPDDSLPYFPLSDDIINIIVNWVNTHLNVDEYAQAYYDNTNHKLKVYSISEKNGMIGHLADGTTPALDVEVTFAAGNKIVLASSENILTIAHEDTTRTDTDNETDITGGTAVVTGVSTDSTGHITGITTYEFPEYTTIAPVQSITGGNHITVSTSNNTATVNHDAVGTGTAVTPTSGTAPDWGGDVLTGVSIDSYGHVAGATKGALPSNPVSAASGTTNQIMVSDGDNTTSTSGKTITTSAPSSSSDDTTIPTSKAVNDSIDTKINALDSSVSADSGKVLTGVTEADGKLTGKTDVDYTTIAPVQSVAGDNKWTSVSTSSNTATVSHIGPDTSSTSPATETAGTAPGFGGNVLTGVTIDGKGHVTGVTTGALPSNPVSGLEGTATDTDSGITVQVESTGGEVDGVNVTVALDTLKSSLGLAGAMIMKGTIGTGGTITTLPTAGAGNLGWTYKVITDNAGITGSKVGDLIVCRAIGTTPETYEWIIIPSGDESFTDTWRNIKVNGIEKLGSGISTGALDVVNGNKTTVTWNGTVKTLQIDHDASTVTADTYGPTADVTGNEGNTIVVPEITVDTYGHITGVTERTYTSKNTTYTASGTNGVTASVDASNVVNVAGVDATTSAKGIVQLNDAYSSTEDTKAATGKSIKAAIDELDSTADADTASGTGYATVTTTTPSADFKVLNSITEADGKLSTADAYQLKKLAATGAAADVSITDTGSLITATNVEGALQEIVTSVNGKVSDVKVNNTSIVDTNNVAQLTINSTIVDSTNNNLDVINTITESSGEISSTKKTLTEGARVKLTAPTTGTDAGKIVISHKKNIVNDTEVNPTLTDNSSTIGERETDVITGVTVDDYGHITGYVKDKSTNLIAADIKSPLTETNDEQFTFRETGEKFDGTGISMGEDVARVDVIEGNTIVWNQYAKEINATNLTTAHGSLSFSGSIATWTCNTASGYVHLDVPVCLGHKIYIHANIKLTSARTNVALKITGNSAPIYTKATTEWQKVSGVETGNNNTYFIVQDTATSNWDAIQIKDMFFVDLTKMFGEGKEPIAEQFEKLFPNSYYPYCKGRLVNLGGYGVKWNQLVDYDSSHYSSWSGAAVNKATQGEEVVFTTNATSPNNVSMVVFSQQISGILDPSHLFYVRGFMKSSITGTVILQLGNTDIVKQQNVTPDVWYELKALAQNFSAPSELHKSFIVRFNGDTSNIGVAYSLRKPQLFDLTAMFGPGSEPTLEEFEAMFPEDYYEYNAGTEMNIFDAIGDKKLGLESTGFNQWDEEWENGYFNNTTGVEAFADSRIRSVGYISALPNTLYTHNLKYELVVGFFDENYNIVQYVRRETGQALVVGKCADASIGTPSFYTPENCAYIRFFAVNCPTYNHDICINISSSRNGEYEPYKKGTLDLDWVREIEYTPSGSSTPEKLFPYGLLSAGSVHDGVTETKAIKRVDIRDYQSGDESDSTVITDGNKTHYALSVPTEIPLAEPHLMGYVVDDKGTETLLPVNPSEATPITAPFAGSITYQSNFKDAVKELIANQQDYEIIHENGAKVTPTTVSHAGIKVTGKDSHTKYYKLPFSAIMNDISTGDYSVQIILNGNFS